MKKLKSLLFALLLIPMLALADNHPDREGSSGLVNINTADLTALTQLKQIGKAKATAIIADRKINGKFGSVKDLTRVKGIGPAILKANKGMITISNKASE